LGYDDVQNVRIGKYIELELNDQDETTARKNAEDACKKLLSNPVMEDYSFELEKM
jgi:phosphoribosylformylglycinamidine synthase